jgi:signal transduction histidine kinase/CheY-like chemotaxis protein/HPt (histidine-containing phosphotransfer) domain-containing protein
MGKRLLKSSAYDSGMLAVTPPDRTPDDDANAGELLAGIEAALAPRAPLLRLPGELERRYQVSTWRGRSRSLRTWLQLIALIDFLCIGIDALVMPAHLTEAVVVRGLILTPLYLGAAALLTRQRPVWAQGLLVMVPALSLLLGAGYLASLAGGAHTERYLLAGLFTVFASTIVPNIALRWMAVQAVLTVVIFAALLFGLKGINSIAGLVEHIELLTFYPVSVLAGLHVRGWIERMHRRNYLMSLRDELRLADLARWKARVDATLANMSQGIVMREGNGLVPVINRRAVELLGLPEDFLHNKKLRTEDIVRYQRQSGEFNDPSLPAELRDRLLTGTARDVPRIYERSRRTGTVLEIRTEPLPDGGFVRTYTDITERKHYETALAKARDVAEAASRARSEFLAMMSHEIRTPMNAVLGLTGSLLESNLDDDQRRSAQAIQEASDGLLAILNDILDLSKLDTGKLEFEAVPFSVESVIDNTRSIVALRATEKGIRLSVELDPEMPKALLGDPSRIRQIVLNLASNAVKFTPSGAVVISARCVERSATRATLRIVVKDSGIGIAPDRLGRLFSDFVQADASIHRQYGGTGLGLAICKRLVEQMGGEIAVESVEGQGSTFSFRVSLALADVADLEQRGGPDAVTGFDGLLAQLGRPLRVLIAEDNATNQFVVTRMMREYDIDLRIANNGVETVAAAKQGDFDVIFMDMRMPEMDGLEATRAIRARGGALAAIPIIALTANAFADDMKACRDAGMNDFVAKPIRKRLLIEKLAKIAQAAVVANAGRALTAATGAKPAPAPKDDLIDRSVVAQLCEEIGAEGTVEILRVFLDETRERLALMKKLSDAGDRAAIEVEAHTLKGAAGAMGFERVAELAKALELDVRAAALFENAFDAESYDAQIDRIVAGFRDSCREMDERPLTDARAA